MTAIATWPFEKKLEETFSRTLPKLGPEARAQLQAIMNPTALAIIAAVLVAWVVSHAFGIGEIIDIVVIVVGVAAVGFAVFAGLDHLYDFATGVHRATSEQDLDAAANDLAKAIGILGIQAVLAVLFRGARAPVSGRGGPINVGPPPAKAPGLRYRPSVAFDSSRAAGTGGTTFYGNIVVSSKGSATDRSLVLLHERVHQFLAPKLYVLRDYRASTRAKSYMRSSLYRYLEEALAETVAQVGVNGIRSFMAGVRFPVQSGYMYIRQGGGYSQSFEGAGLIPEAASLVHRAFVSGIAFEIYFAPGAPAPASAH